MPLKIMTWNIENLGVTKASLPDIMDNIAAVIERERPDLVFVIELLTHSATNPTPANIMNDICVRVQTRAGIAVGPVGDYGTFVLSEYAPLPQAPGYPPVRGEFYGCIIKNLAVTAPYTWTNVAGAHAYRLQAVLPAGGGRRHDGTFPITVPSDAKMVGTKRLRNPPYISRRKPTVGYFEVDTTGVLGAPHGGVHFTMGVLIYHAPPADTAEGDIRALVHIDILEQINNHVNIAGAPAPTLIRGHGLPPLNISDFVITGDFNIDLLTNPAAYTPLVNAGFTARITGPGLAAATHLHPIFPGVPPATTLDLRDHAYDNVFTWGNHLTAANFLGQTIVDLPAQVLAPNWFTFNASLLHYGPTNSRGVTWTPATPATHTWGMLQGGGGAPPLNLRGRLVGAKLISDHLPVAVRFNI